MNSCATCERVPRFQIVEIHCAPFVATKRIARRAQVTFNRAAIDIACPAQLQRNSLLCSAISIRGATRASIWNLKSLRRLSRRCAKKRTLARCPIARAARAQRGHRGQSDDA